MMAECEWSERELTKVTTTRKTWCQDGSLGERLRIALEAMVRGKGKYSQRMDMATFALVPLQERDFPPEYEADAKLLLSARLMGRQEGAAGNVWWNFDSMTPSERDAWTSLLIRMYTRYHQDRGAFAPALVD